MNNLGQAAERYVEQVQGIRTIALKHVDVLALEHALSRREAEIVYLAALALTNAEIGTQLSISDKTVKNHLSAIFGKLKIHSRLQLISRIAPVLQELHG